MLKAALSRLPDDFCRVNSHSCRKRGCVYNERRPGMTAWASTGDRCWWCDPDVLAKSLEVKDARSRIMQNLSMFYARDRAVYQRALQLLPMEHRGHRPSSHHCLAAGCVFSLTAPGETARARCGSCFCSWCNGKSMSRHEVATTAFSPRRRRRRRR